MSVTQEDCDVACVKKHALVKLIFKALFLEELFHNAHCLAVLAQKPSLPCVAYTAAITAATCCAVSSVVATCEGAVPSALPDDAVATNRLQLPALVAREEVHCHGQRGTILPFETTS